MTSFRVIEIDIRADPGTLAAQWLPEERELFLLDEAVLNPLSVDDGIWPKASGERPAKGVRVAILAEPSMPAPGAAEESSQSTAATEWQLLGYDVADAWQVSGLSNCRYSPEEKAALAQIWKPRLTGSGLLRTLAWAEEFVAVANERVTEHAPFFVYEVRSPDVDPSLVVGVSE
jgi:hypothetical protein